jgi:hypothetical protein
MTTKLAGLILTTQDARDDRIAVEGIGISAADEALRASATGLGNPDGVFA